MHGLPKDFDGKFLIGRTLEQVCFSENQAVFHFDGDVDITVESAFAYRDADSVSDETTTMPVVKTTVMRLLGQGVVSAFGDESGTLTLTFSNGDVLKFLNDSKVYESYHIRFGSQTITV